MLTMRSAPPAVLDECLNKWIPINLQNFELGKMVVFCRASQLARSAVDARCRPQRLNHKHIHSSMQLGGIEACDRGSLALSSCFYPFLLIDLPHNN